jgi:hypothetical protein
MSFGRHTSSELTNITGHHLFFSIRTSRDLAAEEARRKQRIHSELQCRHFIEHTRRGETTVGKKETHQIALEDNLLTETHKQGTAAWKGEEAN